MVSGYSNCGTAVVARKRDRIDRFIPAPLSSHGLRDASGRGTAFTCLLTLGVQFVSAKLYRKPDFPSWNFDASANPRVRAIAAFPNRILNIHPSLLPAFPGLDAQHQAFEYGVKIAGCTVHFVDEHLDNGAIILQRTIPVLETDDAHSLADRILVEEHIAYSEAIARVASGEYEIQGRRYVRRVTASRESQC